MASPCGFLISSFTIKHAVSPGPWESASQPHPGAQLPRQGLAGAGGSLTGTPVETQVPLPLGVCCPETPQGSRFPWLWTKLSWRRALGGEGHQVGIKTMKAPITVCFCLLTKSRQHPAQRNTNNTAISFVSHDRHHAISIVRLWLYTNFPRSPSQAQQDHSSFAWFCCWVIHTEKARGSDWLPELDRC